jgi:PTS system nitrogen regulatory IIA component
MHDIMTVEEVAEYLRVSERTIYDWAAKGHIPCGKLGTTWRFKRSEIEQWVDRRLRRTPADASAISIADILAPEHVLLTDATKKTDALEQIIEVISTHPAITDKHELAEGIFRRERLMSTGIGLGIAVPHVRLDSVRRLVMAVGVTSSEIRDYDSLDGLPVRAIFMIAAARDQHAEYIKTLALISRKMKDEQLRRSLFEASDEMAVYNLLTGHI